MPTVRTEQFGELSYDANAELTFPRGLPGFDAYHRFVLVDQPAHAPLVHLQSLDLPDLCFLAAPVSRIDSDYALNLSDDDLRVLGWCGPQPEDRSQILLLALLAVTEDGRLTANLLAPIVINLASGAAVQAVRADNRYSHQHAVGEAQPCS